MRFKIDENLPLEVSELICDFGFNAKSVFDQNIQGCNDDFLFSECLKEERILITSDLDFSSQIIFPFVSSSGIIILRLRRQDKLNILNIIKNLLPILSEKFVLRYPLDC